jgi:ATP-binding cassette subfamily B protein
MKQLLKLPKKLLPFFWHFIRQQWKSVACMQIFFLAWSVDHTFFPYILGMLIDTIVQFETNRAAVWSALSLPIALGILLWLGVDISYRLAGFTSVRVFPQMEASVRMEMFDYVQRHSHTYFSTKFSGTLANQIADMPRTMTNVLNLVMSLFIPFLGATILACIMVTRLQPPFGFILISWLCVHIFLCLYFARKCADYANLHAAARSALSGKIVDSFVNHHTVKLFARHRYEREFLSTAQQEEKTKYGRSLLYIEKMKLALSIASFLGPGIAMNGYMFYSWQQEWISTGDVVFIFNITWNILMMTWIASLELPNLYKEVGVCQQALTTVQEAHEIIDAVEAIPLHVKKGAIAFENVSFNYTPNQVIFRNKNIKIEAGSKVGLVGFSGSGKTTFVHLILRYFDVEGGYILIDNQDIANVSQDSLRSQIAMIPQDASLFHRTLMENIRYGKLDATDEEVIEASRKANCHDFIEKLANKYQTLAGERGVKLSGGQRQRIAIARAILKNAPILILDEATSSLDSVTEKEIQDSLEHLMEGRTCIVVAHRFSTLSGMDRILVFKEGKIVEDGTHQELLDAEGHYADMWNMQAGGFLPDSSELE